MSRTNYPWIVEYRVRAATVPGGSQTARGQVWAPTREAAAQAARAKFLQGSEHRVVARVM